MLALGESIDLGQHAQAVTAMVRVASRLGLQRRARQVDTHNTKSRFRQHRPDTGRE
jgi:hypothetical protein